jgi:hypothetical protein
MGIKCPKCNSTNTKALKPGKMLCHSCAYSWKPYKHRGKLMKAVGDDILFPRKRIMPGAKTETIGDGILFPKVRVKKKRRKKAWFI